MTEMYDPALDAPAERRAGSGTAPGRGAGMRQRAGTLARRYAAAVVLLVIGGIALWLFVPEFYNRPNLLNVGRQTSLVGIVAVGMTFVILTAGIDLSVGATLGLVSVVVGKLLNGGSPEGIAIIAGLAAGVGVGLFNALGVTRFRLQPFIMTLATSAMVAGLALRTTDGTQLQIKLFSGGIFGWLATGNVLGFPAPLVVFIACAILAGIVLRYTPFGRYVYAVGGSQESARLSGIRVWPVLFGVYAIAGVCAAVAGVIFTARLNVADPNAGTLTTLDAIAAVVIGGTSLMGGVGGMLGTVLGAFLLAALANVLNLRGVSPFDQQIVKGAVIVLAVLWASYGMKALPAPRRRKGKALTLDTQPDTVTGTVGMSLNNLGFAYGKAMKREAEDEVKKHFPQLKLTVKDGQGSPEKQTADVDALVAGGVDVLLISPYRSDVLAPAIDRATKAGVKVIAVDRDADAKVLSYIGHDDAANGEAVGDHLAEVLAGKGRIIEITGTPGASPTVARSDGFRRALSKHPGLEVIEQVSGDYLEATAYQAMGELLTRYPTGSFDAIYTHADEMALGIARALREAGRPNEVPMVSINAEQGGLDMIKRGELVATAVYPTLARDGITAAAKTIAGEPIPARVRRSTTLVTKHNVDQFDGKTW